MVVLDIVLQLALPTYSAIVPLGSNAEIGFTETDSQADLHIDVKTILASVFCYCLSAVFRYAAYLQVVVDDTV